VLDNFKKYYLVSGNGHRTGLEERGEYKDRKKETVFNRQVGTKIQNWRQRTKRTRLTESKRMAKKGQYQEEKASRNQNVRIHVSKESFMTLTGRGTC
jgi:hypothetical protein